MRAPYQNSCLTVSKLQNRCTYFCKTISRIQRAITQSRQVAEINQSKITHSSVPIIFLPHVDNYEIAWNIINNIFRRWSLIYLVGLSWSTQEDSSLAYIHFTSVTWWWMKIQVDCGGSMALATAAWRISDQSLMEQLCSVVLVVRAQKADVIDEFNVSLSG